MKPKTKVKAWVISKPRAGMLEVELPAKRIVCDRCEGTGTHTNPNIDSHGITSDEMLELGNEFLEDYLSGAYDVRCEECGGEKVLDVVDVDALTEKMRKRYFNAIDEIRSYEAEKASELRWGC